jgi:hypothetical protein
LENPVPDDSGVYDVLMLLAIADFSLEFSYFLYVIFNKSSLLGGGVGAGGGGGVHKAGCDSSGVT